MCINVYVCLLYKSFNWIDSRLFEKIIRYVSINISLNNNDWFSRFIVDSLLRFDHTIDCNDIHFITSSTRYLVPINTVRSLTYNMGHLTYQQIYISNFKLYSMDEYNKATINVHVANRALSKKKSYTVQMWREDVTVK